jgi:hypothetical protein
MERPDDATAAAPEIENGTAGFDRTADTREVLLKTPGMFASHSR